MTQAKIKKPVSDYVVLPIDEVTDDPRNENFHSDGQRILLRASVRLYGQIEDILIDRKKMCIAGHGIKQAMKDEGHTHISCKYSDLKGAKRSAYRVATNQLARLSHFDTALYEANVREISAEMGKDFDPSWLGLETSEWEHLLHGDSWHGKTIDADTIGDYDAGKETFLIKIEGVGASDKEDVLLRITRALKGTSYEARAY